MKSTALVFTAILLLASCQKQETLLTETPGFSLEEIAALPAVLTESSGLEMTGDDLFWSFNDKNGQAELYGFSASGELKTTLAIPNASNKDWEDMAQDEPGNLYVGDFGNNENDRQNLKIYKLPPPETGQSNISGTAEKIEFSYPDQTAFPPPESGWHFDTEAMFAYGGWLYLLTKDRSKPFAGKTRLYRLPDAPGTHEAEFLVEFFTDKSEVKGQITSADISPDGSVLALLSNEMLYIFRDFSGNDFFSGTPERNELPLKRQMEGVVFLDNCMLYLTNEAKSGEPAMLYRVKICP